MDIEQTVKDARDLRHSLAHGLSSNSQIEELVETVPRLTVIVEVCLLSALDLENELVIDQMNQQHSHELN
ncbi:HEPN domain-containing protein [Halorubrum distributum]|uniref:HEPN domain-containing protein n=1 Tax=Halorubrum distributum TaxID=29283 RepID=UPI00373AF61E